MGKRGRFWLLKLPCVVSTSLNGVENYPPLRARVRAMHGRQAGWCSLIQLAHCTSTLPGTEQVLTEQRDWWRNALRPSREPIVRDNSPSYTAAAIMLSLLLALCASLKRSSLPAAARTAQTAWDNTLKQFAQSLAHGT